VEIDVRTQDLVKIIKLRGKLNLGSSLLNPSKFALQTLKLVRVLSLFEVFEDQQAAVASFQ
jgi:hypothetical protein